LSAANSACASRFFSDFGVITGMPKLLGHAMHRAFLHLHAAPRRGRRAGIDADHLMALPDDLGQHGHREIRRAHEDDAQGHGLAFLRPASRPARAPAW
jgi:hypothetical protein